jgi:tetratricopeptide (TPR) repeat protein
MKAGRTLLAGLLLAATAMAGDLGAGWQALANYRAAPALEVFDRELTASDPALQRKAQFGRGVALLDRQPVSASQVEEARAILTGLADSGTDDCAQGARFFLGRIAQHHLAVPDAAEAARQYRRLIAEHENSVWAQTALSRLALVEIYELDQDQAPAARLAEAEKLLAHARLPAAESEVRLVIADAIFFYRLPSGPALPHLLAAEKLGRMDWTVRMDVLVQIAELSRLEGNRAQAAKFYRQFLKENPRDLRHYNVQQRLAEMEKPTS